MAISNGIHFSFDLNNAKGHFSSLFKDIGGLGVFRFIGFLGVLFLATTAVAEDLLQCSTKETHIELTIPQTGKVKLIVNRDRVEVAKDSWTYSMNRRSEAIVPEELALSVEPRSKPKKEYRFENLRHCGDGEDVRVRIYETTATSKVFIEEISCSCKNT